MLRRFIVIAVLFTGCHPAPKPAALIDPSMPAVEKNYLPVDSLISIRYTIASERYIFGFDERNSNKKYLKESEGYDENKNLLEHLTYRPDGQIEQHVVYVYEDGLLKDEYRSSGSSSMEELYKTNYNYDANRKLSSSVLASFKRRVKKDTTTQWKCMLMESDFEEIKSWGDMRTTRYSYDSKGNLIEENTESENSPGEIEIYAYNNEGKVTEELTMSSGEVSRRITTTYFTDGLESICIFSRYESGNRCTQKFDKNNNLLVEQCEELPNKKPWFTRKYFYDSKKRIVKEEYITDIGTSIITLYEYTDHDKPKQKVFRVDNK